MAKIKYIGKKPNMPIFEPVGVKPRRSALAKGPVCVMNPGEEKELSQEEAEGMCRLDPKNFELVGKAKKEEPKEEAKSEVVEDDGMSVEEAAEEMAEEAAPKRRRRSKSK